MGVGFLLLTVLTLVGCVNYSLSLGYGATFLLAGVWAVTAGQAMRAGRALRVKLDAPMEAFAGTESALTGGATGLAGTPFEVRLGTTTATGRTPAEAAGRFTLKLPAQARGPLTLPRVQIAAYDSLGLWRWVQVLPLADVGLEVLPAVFPAPEQSAPPPTRRTGAAGEGLTRTAGTEDFSGLRAYVPGDSPRLVSWKHAARTGTLLTREFDAPAGTALMFDWADTAALGNTEARLSRLSAWIGAARASGLPFGLTLPGHTLPVAAGEAHARASLTALALHQPLPAPLPAPKSPHLLPILPAAALRFTLFGLAVALAPGVLRQPVWVSVLSAVLLGYTAWQTRPLQPQAIQTWRLPRHLPSWLLGIAAGLAAVALNAEYGTLLGSDAGTALLGLLVALKAAESRNMRDARLLVLLGLFVTFTHFLHGQGPLVALHALLSITLMLAVAGVWVVPNTQADTEPGPLRTAGKVVALALPLMLVLFVLFPRPDGPLWQLPLQGRAQTGLSDEIRAGEFSDLARSNAVAFRADFSMGLPDPQDRYWRGPVFEGYDGLAWTQARLRGASPSIEATGPESAYTLTLEPNGKPWLLALDVPTQLPPGAFLSTAFQAVNPRPSTNRARYAIRGRSARLGVQESPERLNYNLLLPVGQSPRARDLAASWTGLAPAARIEAALNYLQTGGFTYTLNPPILPEENRVDAFLFGTSTVGARTGFCEHYASAFAFLMRAAGLPARIVGGYLGGEINPDGGYLIVRQQDAHAWVEVWLAGRGWTRVDPTAVVAPARLNTNLSTALTRPNATQAAPIGTFARLRLRVDALQNRWNDTVVGYNGEQQRSLLGRVGLGEVGAAPYLLALLGLIALAFVPALLVARRAARPRDLAARALHDLTLRLRLPRAPGETASAYALRVQQRWPQSSESLSAFLNAYHEARYSPEASPEGAKKLRELVRKVRR
ncbi:transglutaminase [Deinococcus puniceus]|uniref:Transglutaminase n=2 Tax=Deinococcus puniceus TaxID=1182568 RepID=A0A172T7X0_9DEIO|nr:transglutaminaseTgpA domain-containing protein [Deinococcus puniceus]ANE43091.1 transglutaminase [Deinococcus puniceus]